MAKERSEYMFPSLEYRAASLLFDCWAKRCDELAAKPAKIRTERESKRFQQLKDKLQDVQAAIGRGTGKGATAKLPNEIVYHEYGVVKEAVDRLYEDAGDRDNCWMESQIMDASCQYPVELPDGTAVVAERPLFLHTARVEKHIGSTPRDAGRPSDLAELLTADLFCIQSNAVPAKLAIVREEDRLRAQPKGAAKFLIAAFMLEARIGTEDDLQRIIGALFRSGYDAIAIYHLALYVSSMPEQDRSRDVWVARPTMDWDTVETVVKALAEPCDQTVEPDQAADSS